MRKIDKQVAQAFATGKRIGCGNTITTPEGNVFLHGNLIARRVDGVVQLTTAGWPGPTTKGRLNAICEELGVRARFHTVKGELYFDAPQGPARAIGDSEWITL